LIPEVRRKGLEKRLFCTADDPPVWRRTLGAIAKFGGVLFFVALLIVAFLPSPGSLVLALRVTLVVAALAILLLYLLLVRHLGWWAAVAPRGEVLDTLEAEEEEEADQLPPTVPHGDLSAREVVAAADRSDGNHPDAP
jgi:hypothetical protein